MPVNCTQCGAPIQANQKFCVQCGAALNGSPAPAAAEEPKLDLSAYFDNTPQTQEETEPAYQPELEQAFQAEFEAQAPVQPQPPYRPQQEPRVPYPAQPQRPQAQNPQPRRPSAPPKAEKAAPKSDRGLNTALLICTVLAVAVLTFVIVLLLIPKSSSSQNVPQEDIVIVTGQPQEGQLPSPAVSEAPTVIVTPTPLPATPTPAPTPSPTPTPKPASEYLLPESNTRYLTEADLSGLTHEELCFARNEIFARHGRIFQTPEIAAYFNSKSWYHGTVSASNFSTSVFNEYERANIALIKDYENKYYGGSYY